MSRLIYEDLNYRQSSVLKCILLILIGNSPWVLFCGYVGFVQLPLNGHLPSDKQNLVMIYVFSKKLFLFWQSFCVCNFFSVWDIVNVPFTFLLLTDVLFKWRFLFFWRIYKHDWQDLSTHSEKQNCHTLQSGVGGEIPFKVNAESF